MPNKDGIDIVTPLSERQVSRGLILLSSADPQYLKIAATIAVRKGLCLLASFLKPLEEDAFSCAVTSNVRVCYFER